MNRRALFGALLALLALAPAARAAGPDAGASASVSGTWIATKNGGGNFAGQWTAEIAIATPNIALGTWVCTDPQGAVVMQGTWSARKAPKGWRGAWSARLAPAGNIISGTWEADDRPLKGRSTFADLLRHTAMTQIAGVWRAGRASGNWSLQSRP
jgi:hypothetical protein